MFKTYYKIINEIVIQNNKNQSFRSEWPLGVCPALSNKEQLSDNKITTLTGNTDVTYINWCLELNCLLTLNILILSIWVVNKKSLMVNSLEDAGPVFCASGAQPTLPPRHRIHETNTWSICLMYIRFLAFNRLLMRRNRKFCTLNFNSELFWPVFIFINSNSTVTH